jgi:CheY-like chemotaxis protein
MPRLGGVEFTARMRAHVRWQQLPVVIMGARDNELRTLAQEAGANMLLIKPLSHETLLQILSRLAATAPVSAYN